MTDSVNRTTLKDIELLLKPIRQDSPCGENLRYDAIFDQVKEARREDDSTLSQGVWEAPLKRADWPLVETICCDVLINKSKDLHFAGWLVESWIVMDGLPGFGRGLTFLSKLCKTYWSQLHPQEDRDYRLPLLEWFQTLLEDRLIRTPFITNALGDTSLSLADWIHGHRVETLTKQVHEGQKQVIARALERKEAILSEVNEILEDCSLEHLQTLDKNIQEVLEIFQSFKTLLDELSKGESPAFTPVLNRLQEIQRMIKAGITLSSTASKKSEEMIVAEDSPEPLEVTPSASRSETYQQLRHLGQSLAKTEPHSPVPPLLNKMAEWENKTLGEIFADLKSYLATFE